MLKGDSQVYRTTDLAEASLLAANGYKYELERLNQHQAAWVFGVTGSTEEDFFELSEQYQGRSARVEPRAFLAQVKKVRNELYRFLGDDAPRKPDLEPDASPVA